AWRFKAIQNVEDLRFVLRAQVDVQFFYDNKYRMMRIGCQTQCPPDLIERVAVVFARLLLRGRDVHDNALPSQGQLRQRCTQHGLSGSGRTHEQQLTEWRQV